MEMSKLGKLILAVVCLLTVNSVANAAVTLVDDFDSYTAGTSIDGQGAWEAQANTTSRVDSENSNVVLFGGDNALQMVNRDTLHPGTLQTVYTSMALPSTMTTGTVYLRWLKSSEGADPVTDAPAASVRGDMILATNGLPTGFDPDGDLFLNGDGQEAANYGSQAALVGLYATAGGTQFHARNGTGYKDVDTPFAGNLVEDQWYEMWMQVDHTALQQTRYYIAEDGGTPQVVLNELGGEWWAHRNTSYSEATAIKFLHGSFNVSSEATVYVDTVGVDLAAWSTNSLVDGVPEPASVLLLMMGGVFCLAGRRRS